MDYPLCWWGNCGISGVTLIFDEGREGVKCYLQAKGLSLSMKRTESSEETESTTTASRRGSDDSDSGVNLSEKEMTNQHQPGRRPARPAQPPLTVGGL